MATATKNAPINGRTLISDLKTHFSLFRTKRTIACGFMLVFVVFTVFIAFSPSPYSSSSWFTNIFSSSNSSFSKSSTPIFSNESSRSQFASVFSYFFPNSTQQLVHNSTSLPSPSNITRSQDSAFQAENLEKDASIVNNQTQSKDVDDKVEVLKTNQSTIEAPKSPVVSKPRENSTSKSFSDLNKAPPDVKNQTQAKQVDDNVEALKKPNQSTIETPKSPVSENHSPKMSSEGKNITGNGEKRIAEKDVMSNQTSSLLKKKSNLGVSAEKQRSDNLAKSLMNCNLFDGNWVRDESYPLYKPGSCSLIDEQFNCFLNGRPDNGYYKHKWKPKACSLPRLNGSHMLELLRGKRLVFVGDSLNRNMWESLICILKNSVKDQRKVYEESGRHHFRAEASYSFMFEDYKSTVEFFVYPFLVEEWEMPDKNGSKKETLRLDIIGKSADKYKNADILVFNTGHWWTHEKTSKGKDYYQEGNHVYNELNVIEAFRKALTTWGRWVDANVNPMKTLVFFRGYSASHFSGGQWNSGGQCDNETEPIKNETYLSEYPPKMTVLESVLKGMKTHVSYLNITRITDYRKDGHPSIYRKLNLSKEEKRSPLSFQDCSHWCLPGVPDSWNELLYAELLVKLYQRQQKINT